MSAEASGQRLADEEQMCRRHTEDIYGQVRREQTKKNYHIIQETGRVVVCMAVVFSCNVCCNLTCLL